MQHSNKTDCPCGSGLTYQECCQSFHKGAWPKTALALMRSRYSAYALNIPDYIMLTTHPESDGYTSNEKKWKIEIAFFSSSVSFQGLEILDDQEGSQEAYVTFIAFLKQGPIDATFTEKSLFKKKEGHWLYHSGKVAKGALSAAKAKQLK